jgi:hypothetical protein
MYVRPPVPPEQKQLPPPHDAPPAHGSEELIARASSAPPVTVQRPTQRLRNSTDDTSPNAVAGASTSSSAMIRIMTSTP